MNVTTIEGRISERLDDDGTYYPTASLLDAINKGQRLFALISRCVERSVTLTVSTGVPFYLPRTSIASDYLLPLRVTGINNKRIKPQRFHDLDAIKSAWITTQGTEPDYYASAGFDLFAVSPTPLVGTTNLSVTYVAEPTALTAGGDTPEIPAENHPALVDFGVYWCRLKEGGQECANVMPMLERFIKDALAVRAVVRDRSIAHGFDSIPPEVKLSDMSRLFKMKIAKAA